MSMWRKSAILLIGGGIILAVALMLTLSRLGGPSPAPAWLASASVPSTSALPLAPTETVETHPTPSVTLAATPTEPAATAAAAYPAPAQLESSVPEVTDTAPPAGTMVGQLAPDFDLRREDGSQVRLSDYRGKQTVVLVFFRGQT